MTFSIKINNRTVDDRVLSCSPIPHLKRDRVFQPLFAGFEMSVTQIDGGFPIQKGHDIIVKEDGDIRYSGYVLDLITNESNITYELTIINSLALLKDFTVDYATLHTAFTGGTENQYKDIDNEGYPNVALLWAMQKMFAVAGLSLDVTNVEDLVAAGTTWSFPKEKNQVLDENSLYALNQATALNHILIDTDGETYEANFESNKITFAEFFQRACIARRFYVQPSTTQDEYILYSGNFDILPNDNYTVADNDKLAYTDHDPDSENLGGNFLEIKFGGDASGGRAASDRGMYAGIEFAPIEVDVGDNKFAITDHRIKTDSAIRFTSDDTLPGGISASVLYFVIDITDNTFRISLEKNGSIVGITNDGAGTHSYYAEYEIGVHELQDAGTFKVPYWNNLKIRFHANGTSTGQVQAGSRGTRFQFGGGYLIEYQVNPFAYEDITSPPLDYSKPRMTEHWINIKNRTHRIKQMT